MERIGKVAAGAIDLFQQGQNVVTNGFDLTGESLARLAMNPRTNMAGRNGRNHIGTQSRICATKNATRVAAKIRWNALAGALA